MLRPSRTSCRPPSSAPHRFTAMAARISAIAVATSLCLSPTPPALAADPYDLAVSPNLLDHPWVDAAALAQTGPDGVPNLLVLEPLAPDSTVVHVSILERDGTWRQAASTIVDLATEGTARFDQPWLVGLGGDRFAMLATSEPATGIGPTEIVILVASDEAGRRVVQERERTRVGVLVDAAGAADIAADGVPDLVVASSTGGGPAAACRGSTMAIFPDGRLSDPVEHAYPDLWFGTGVVGSFDTVPGDDLVLYAATACPATSTAPTLGLGAIRLKDGRVVHDQPVGSGDGTPRSIEPPIRFDVDADGRDELLARSPRGLAVIDPSRSWSAIRLATSAAFALAAAPVATGGDAGLQTRVAWMEPSTDGRGSIGTALVRRTADGTLDAAGATVLSPADSETDRWNVAVAAATATANRGASPTGWTAGPPPGCPDTYVTTAILVCATAELRSGPAWIGTRPLLAIDPPGARRLLVAAGLDRDVAVGVPAMPDAWAGSAPGAWRHGPSSRFALAEVDVDPTGSLRPLDRPTIGPVAGRGPSATFGGRGGMRLVVSIEPAAADASEPDPAPGLFSSLTSSAAAARRGLSVVVRLPVAPDQPSGGDRASTSLSLADVRSAGGADARRWDVTALPLDDLGDLEDPLAASITVDEVKPALTVPVPFTTAVWPFVATLTGQTEPGATVEVAGGVPATVADDGSFTFPTTLAPWPQEVRVAAIDAVGNRTETTVSVIGGIDYRTFPWAAIIAITVLTAVIATGIVGNRRRQGSVALPGQPPRWEDGPGPELEELPPGGGL